MGLEVRVRAVDSRAACSAGARRSAIAAFFASSFTWPGSGLGLGLGLGFGFMFGFGFGFELGFGILPCA